MKLHPSQIAALIQRGTPSFPYRDPQSAMIIPEIDLSEKELIVLAQLNRFSFEGEMFRLNHRALGRLGCCGDCEQTLFTTYLDLIEEALGLKPELALHSRDAKVQGIEELARFLQKEKKMHFADVITFIAALVTFCHKAQRALANQIAWQPYHPGYVPKTA